MPLTLRKGIAFGALAAVLLVALTASATLFITGGATDAAPGGVTDDEELWAFRTIVRPGSGDGPGSETVLVTLVRLLGDVNASAEDGAMTVEVLAVAWDARETPTAAGTPMRDRISARLAEEPPVAFTRAALSRHDDAVELSVPKDLDARTVLVRAPETGEFVAVAWPAGQVHGWDGQAGEWTPLTGVQSLIRARLP